MSRRKSLIATALLAGTTLSACQIQHAEGFSEAGGKPSVSTTTLSRTQAEDIALSDAGLSREQVTNWDRSELDSQLWEIEFDVGVTEYEYDIDTHTGAITSRELEN